MDTDRIVLGVDVGGTKIRYGLMDMKGTILADDQCRSRAMPCREWFSFITEKLDSFLKANPEGKAAQAIGLGIRGSIDHRSRRLRSSSVVRPDGFDLCGALSAYYQIPVFLENDVKASTVSELLYGEFLRRVLHRRVRAERLRGHQRKALGACGAVRPSVCQC